MASSIRVFNQTRGCYMKRNQALKGVDNCAFAWVEFGVSVRVLTCEEAVQARRAQVKNDAIHSPLPFAEWPGLVFRPSDRTQATHQEEIRLMQKANRDHICRCGDCTKMRERQAQRAAAEAVRFVAVQV